MKEIKSPRNMKGVKARGADINFYTEECYELDEEVVNISKILGVVPDLEPPKGWIDCVGNIEEHRDYFGRCLLYCSAGKGILHTESGSAFLQSRQFTIFDDGENHSLEVFKEMRLLVFGLKRRLAKGGDYGYTFKPLRRVV